MSVDACAALVRRGDPDRFAAAMTAPLEVRGDLLVLAAFNLEVARAPWVTEEPLIAEMRLQWWTDALGEIFSGGMVRSHEVTTPLAETVVRRGLDQRRLAGLVEARRREISREPPGSSEEIWRYIDETAGAMMALAAQICAGGQGGEAARILGQAQGMAGYLLALRAIFASGRRPMVFEGAPDPADLAKGRIAPEIAAEVAALSEEGLMRIAAARMLRAEVPPAASPALRAAWTAEGILSRIASDPALAFTGGAAPTEFRRRARLLWLSARGQW